MSRQIVDELAGLLTPENERRKRKGARITTYDKQHN